MSQCEKLLRYLREHGSITGMECITKLHILNYKGRICDLRQLGYNIETVMETRVNSAGEKTTFARYYMREAISA